MPAWETKTRIAMCFCPRMMVVVAVGESVGSLPKPVGSERKQRIVSEVGLGGKYEPFQRGVSLKERLDSNEK